jgi:hypothetical protein
MLAEAGFRLAALEVPVRTGLGTVTLDGVADAHETNDLLVVECKSGANIEVDQARKLGELDAVSVVQSASITLSQPTRPRVEVLYLCLAEHVDRIVFGLKQSGWQGPGRDQSWRYPTQALSWYMGTYRSQHCGRP